MQRPHDMDAPLAWAEFYLSLGWVLSHFPPGTKGPTGTGWNTPALWIDSLAKATAQWSRTPAHGMGVIHAGSGTVAIDIDSIEHTRRVFAEFGIDIDALLASAPRVRGKRSGRDKAIFRAPEGEPLSMHKFAWKHPSDATQSVTLFELRSGAVHDCLPPSLHPDGHRYEWRTAPWDLPEIPTLPTELLSFWKEAPTLREQIAALAPWASPATPGARPRTLAAEGHNDVIGEFNRAHSVHALLLANGYERKGSRYLAPSSSSKLPGVVVLDDGRVYSHHGSDPLADGHAHDAFDLWTIFDYGGDVRAAVKAASTLLDLPVYGEKVSPINFSELLAPSAKRDLSPKPPAFPEELLGVPGLLGELATYMNSTAHHPQPILALGAAIAAAGTLMGRKVQTETGLRTNLYVLAVGEAGSGKDHARQVIRRVFDAAGALKRVHVESLASDAALNTAIVGCPSSLFLLDEIGRFLAVVNDARASAHLSEIVTALLRVYSSAQGPYCGKVYADADRNDVVQQPNLSIYGTTAPAPFYRSLSTSQIEDGFLSRLLVFESEDPDPEPCDVVLADPPYGLIEQCGWWERAPEAFNPQGNVDAILRPSPRIVTADSSARLILSRFRREMRERRQRLRAEGRLAPLYVRTWEAAQKLALIRACGTTPENPLITGPDAAWACALAGYLADAMAWRVVAHVAETGTERNVKRVGTLIRDAGDLGLTKSQLTKKLQWLRKAERDEVIQTLVESGEVVLTRNATSGRTSERYHWADPATLLSTSFKAPFEESLEAKPEPVNKLQIA